MRISDGTGNRPELSAYVTDTLLEDESVDALFAVRRSIPPANFLVITNNRVLTVAEEHGEFVLVDDVDGADIDAAHVKSRGPFVGRVEVLIAGSIRAMGTIGKPSSEDLRHAKAVISAVVDQPSTIAKRQHRHDGLAASVGDLRAYWRFATRAGREHLEDHPDHVAKLLGQGARVVGTTVSRAVLEAITGDGRADSPWLVINASGTEAIVAYDDGLAMCSGLIWKGQRPHSFRNVGFIQYGSVSSVEHQPIVFGGELVVRSSRQLDATSAASEDHAYKLQLPSSVFREVEGALEELRRRVVEARDQETTLAPPAEDDTSSRQRPAAPGTLIDQLERLAEMHGTGVLTDAEFSAAKAAILPAR